VLRLLDEIGDISTLPPDVTPLSPPQSVGEDVDYTLLLEATDSVTEDQWDETIAILEQRMPSARSGVHLAWVSVGQAEVRLSAHTLTVGQAIALATPKGHFAIIERKCESDPCDAEGAYVDKPTGLTNTDIESASFGTSYLTGAPIILFQMTHAGAQVLADITTRLFDTNVYGGTPDQMAFALDGAMLVSRVVSSPVYGGAGSIYGDFTEEEAQVIAALIASPLPPVALRLVSAETR
jgi:preprotein translocase subunit SecD